MADIYLTNNFDPYNIKQILQNKGFSVNEAGVKGASSHVWYEEEGIYIPLNTIVLGLVDDDFFQWVHCYGAIGKAISSNMPVILFLNADTPFQRQQIALKWPSIENECIFSSNQIDAMIAKIQNELLKTNKSELFIREYINNGLYQQALKVILNRVEYFKSMLNSSFIHHDCEEELFYLYERAAFVSAVLHRFDDFEMYIRECISFGDKQGKHTADFKKILEYFLQNTKNTPIEQTGFTTDTVCSKGKQYFEKVDSLSRIIEKQESRKQKVQDSDYILLENSIQATVALFEKLSSHSEGYKHYLIECYERLIEYSRLIGDEKILQTLTDKVLEIKLENTNPESDSSATNDINMKCIKAYLGHPLPESHYFDVFISHKSEDCSMANDVFSFLRRSGREVFFDRESLSEMGNSEYTDSIMTAIDNSTHFVLVCSNIEYLKSPWVKREYSLFSEEICEGRKSGNIILVLGDKAYHDVILSNKKILPLQLRPFEIMPFSSFQDKISDYI